MEQIKTDALRDINRHHEESKEKREIENNRIQIKKEREKHPWRLNSVPHPGTLP